MVRSVKPDDMECIYVRQAQALGLSHAVLCGQRLVGNEPFAVLLADDLMVGEPPVLQQMVEQFAEMARVHPARAGGARRAHAPLRHRGRPPVNERLIDVQRIVEKPAPEARRRGLGVAGRYILTPGVFHEIAGPAARRGRRDPAHRRHRPGCCAARRCSPTADGQRYDCGSKEGFLEANVELALATRNSGPDRAYLENPEALRPKPVSGGAACG